MESNAHKSEEPLRPTEPISGPALPPANLPPASAAECGSESTLAVKPVVLERSAFEFHLQEYVRELQPVGHVELVVVRDMARQTAAMEVWNEGVGALQRQRAQRLTELILPEGNGGAELEDVSLAAAVSAPEVHLSEHHGQKRSRAFYRALHTPGLAGKTEKTQCGWGAASSAESFSYGRRLRRISAQAIRARVSSLPTVRL